MTLVRTNLNLNDIAIFFGVMQSTLELGAIRDIVLVNNVRVQLFHLRKLEFTLLAVPHHSRCSPRLLAMKATFVIYTLRMLEPVMLAASGTRAESFAAVQTLVTAGATVNGEQVVLQSG